MWIANVVFGVLALILLARMGKESGLVTGRRYSRDDRQLQIPLQRRPATSVGARQHPGQRIVKLVRPLDKYVFSEWIKIFLATSLGFPLLLIIFDATDNLDKYLAKKLPPENIALSYVYWLPDSIFLILPAAVLFATVFSIGAFTRHSEITAAKASGVSFYRFIAPIFLGAVLAAGCGTRASVNTRRSRRSKSSSCSSDRRSATRVSDTISHTLLMPGGSTRCRRCSSQWKHDRRNHDRAQRKRARLSVVHPHVARRAVQAAQRMADRQGRDAHSARLASTT